MEVLVYNNARNRMERYIRGLNDPMPYNEGRTLTVREFRGVSDSPVVWTDTATMSAWNRFRRQWGKPINVGYAFRRIWEGGHTGQSQHYAGTAFDVGQNIGDAQRALLRNAAQQSGIWTYVEPVAISPTWVHFDKRNPNPACTRGGYPLVRRGSRGNYVLVMQDALATLGYTRGGLDGIFGARTEEEVKRFQRDNNLTADGIVGCDTWVKLTALTNGRGRTSTVIKP